MYLTGKNNPSKYVSVITNRTFFWFDSDEDN
jgi:hypothetical protein